jgi:hypothetical protein
MNPIEKELLLTILRYVIVGALSALLSHHVITEDQQKRFIDFFTDPAVLTYIAGAIFTIWIAVRVVIKSRLKLLTALATPAATTEKTIEQMAKTDAPALSTPKADVPIALPKPTPNEPKE